MQHENVISHNISIRKEQIQNNLNLILKEGEVCEVRLLHVGEGNKRFNLNGYYNDLNALAEMVAHKMDQAKMIIISVQKLNPEVLNRRKNRIERMQSGDGVSDEDVTAFKYFIIDVDPVKPRGLSANSEEHQEAIKKAEEIAELLSFMGWPEPIFADSSNGSHLLYRVDLGREDDSLVKEVLKKIANIFNDDHAKIDESFAKPTQPLKVYGTQSKKGDPTEERPHRYSRIISHPETPEIVSKQMLEDLCSELEEAEEEIIEDTVDLTRSQSISDFILKYIPGAREKENDSGFRLWIVECPNHPEDHKGKAYIYFAENGALGMKCHGGRCKDFKMSWGEIVNQYAPEDYVKSSFLKSTNSFSSSDRGNALRLIRKHGDILRYVYEKKLWLHFDGKKWSRNRDGIIERLAKDTLESMIFEEGVENSWTPEEVKSWHSKCLTPGKINSMLAYASTESGVAIVPEILDRDQMMFNVLNGTIDLKTGQLLPHNPDDYHSKIACVEYNSSATCKRWTEKFLPQIFDGDIDLIKYVQKAIGYCLTGKVSEQCLFFLMGGGKNGKTTFLNVIRLLIGEYCSQAAPNILLRSKFDEHPTAIADLAGKRVVIAVEPDKNKPIAEGTLKALTGNDAIKARFMHEDFFEFTPTHKIFLMANHLPSVNDTSYGFWRRIKLIPFNVRIPKHDRIPDYELVLAEELPGILNWAIEGCLKWHEEGLDEPEAVTQFTNAYKVESDIIEDFISECCVRDIHDEVAARNLYMVYKKWCEFTGNKAYNQKRFGTSLKEHGFTNQKRGNVFWLGLRLRDDPDVQDH